MEIIYVGIRKKRWKEKYNTTRNRCVINRLRDMCRRYFFYYGQKNELTRIGFAMQKLGEDYVNLTICEKRCYKSWPLN